MRLLTLAAVLLFSCKLQNQIVLESVGQGRMALSLELPPYMLDSLEIVADSIPGGQDLLEPESIKKGLLSSPDIREVKVVSDKKGAYDIRFRFANFEQSRFLRWNREPDGNTRLLLVVNRQSYEELERRFPSLRDNALFQLYGPATTAGMSRSDYLDMVEYSFGPEARRDLPAAEAVISVEVPGRIIRQTGGTKKNGNTVEFRLRLLDFALLSSEKRYSIVYS